MKKAITILAACMLVFSFAGIAAATSAQDALQAINCGGEPGYIDRGCESEQMDCGTFDFDAPNYMGGSSETDIVGYGVNYCDKRNNRAVFPVCDCIPAPFDNIIEGETYEIGMKIWVDKKDGNGPVVGNNGVYWAQNVDWGIPVRTYGSQQAACTDYNNANPVTDSMFSGPFDYMLANGATITTTGLAAVPNTTQICQVPEQNQVVEFRNTLRAGGGYTVTPEDDIQNASNWVVDIPAMRADVSKVQGGWDVYVEVCFYETSETGDGICADCESCCFVLKIGTLCCPDDVVAGCSDTLIFPYLGRTDGAWWNGVAVTNLSDKKGDATVTLYEGGDVYTGTVTIEANTSKVIDVTADLSRTTEGGDGVLGNERAYVKVVTDGFAASGFAMMAKEDNGVSMGYLPVEADCSNCRVPCE